MSSTRCPNNLVDIDTAKDIFRGLLQPRIDEYEVRLKKSFLERFSEYVITGYGEDGYVRTQAFIADMEKAKKTEELIDLVQQEKYAKGTNMPPLLQEAVILACGFTMQHIELVFFDVKDRILSEGALYQSLNVWQARVDAIHEMYQVIINSTDHGASCRDRLNRRLKAIEKRLDNEGMCAESNAEMTVFRRRN